MASRMRRYQYRPPKTKEWTAKGWRGMYDSRADVQDPDEAPLLINLMPSDLQRPGPVYLRPGRQTLGALATAARVGDGSHAIQWIGEVTLTNPSGARRIIAIADGEIFEISVSAGTSTEKISTANLSSASITLSSANHCYCCVFDGSLIVSDGTNVPFAWNGTANGGLTKLTNAPTGPLGCTVYYAKLFFLKSDRRTIVWSEELQVNTGYEAGGFNNAWELTQTTEERIAAIYGTNQGLYYGRDNSVGIIRGAVSSTFKTDGVHDSVYDGAGPDGNSLWTYGGNTLFWANLKGEIYAYREGGEVVNLTDQAPRIFGYQGLIKHASNTNTLPVYGLGEEDFGTTNVAPQLLVCDTDNQRLYAEYGGSTAGRFTFVYDIPTLRLISLWDFGTANDQHVSTFASDQRFACYAHSAADGGYYVYVDEDGYVFQQCLLSDNLSIAPPPTADFTEAGVGTAVTGTLLGPKHGHSHRVEWQFDELHIETDELPSNSITVGYLTSRFHKVSLTPADQTVTNSSITTTPFAKHRAFGLGRDASGRWLRPVIKLTGSTSTTAGNQPPQLFGYTLTGHAVSTVPSTI